MPEALLHKRTNAIQRDLLAEIAQIINSTAAAASSLDYNDDVSDDYNCVIGAQKSKIPKKEYRRSPLAMPTPSSSQYSYCPLEDSSEVDNYEIESSTKFRNYKNNNDVAYHCQKLLKITAYPTVAQITILVHEIKRSDASNTQELDVIKRKALQWFRKRREYLALKVYNVCDELMESVWDAVVARSPKLTYDATVEEIVSDEALMLTIFEAAKLPVKDQTNGLSFVRRKVKDYFNKLCTRTINSE